MMQADIFALASRYEVTAWFLRKALSHGLPIVACAAGAVPEVVPDTAGFLVPVDDVDAFANALRSLLTQARPHPKAEGAAKAGECLPSWDETAATLSSRLQELK